MLRFVALLFLVVPVTHANLIELHSNYTREPGEGGSCMDIEVDLTVPAAASYWKTNAGDYKKGWETGLCNTKVYDSLDSTQTYPKGVVRRFLTKMQHLISCPLRNETDYVEFYVTNTTDNYCGPTQIRTCSDPNGCVGKMYHNTSTLYQRCSPEYMNKITCTRYPCPHADWEAYAQLPARVRVDPDTKYLVFVCDESPGVKVPVVQEYWPPGDIKGLQGKSLPPMAKLDCSNTVQDTAAPYGSKGWRPFHCPWVTEDPHLNPHDMCDACTDCRPYRPNDPSYHPVMWNISIDNTKMDVAWRIDLVMGPSWPPIGPRSTCAWGKGYRGDGSGDMSPFSGPDPTEYLVPPYSNTSIAIPPGVSVIYGIPMYSTGVGVCVVQERSGFPKHLHMDRRYPSGPIDGGCIDSDGVYPGRR